MPIPLRSAVLCAGLVVATAASAKSTLQTVLKRQEFLAGIIVDYPPSAAIDAPGHQIGFCADVPRYLSRRLGVNLTFVAMTAAC